MPFVERLNGVVTGVYENPQPGYAEEYLAPDHFEIVAFRTPAASAPPAPHLNNSGGIRFTGRPVTVLESIRFMGATRLSRGVYWALLSEPYPNDQYMAIPALYDPNPCSIRATARTASYIELRVVNAAGAPYDPQEITLKTERVVEQ